MSGLVAKVRDALADHWDSADIVNGETQARVAIAAVAEWLAEHEVDVSYMQGLLHSELKHALPPPPEVK